MQGNNTIYQRIFDNAREGMILTDAEGRIILINPRAVELFKYDSKDELLHKKIEVLVPPHLRKTHEQYREMYYRSPQNYSMSERGVLEGYCKDGSTVYLEISLSYFEDESGNPNVLCFLSDVTPRIRTELALQRERELHELKSRFVSMVSHELRTPLSNIYTSATLLSRYQDRSDQEKRERHIQRIKRSVKSLIELLEDILSFQKFENIEEQLRLEHLSVQSLVQEAIAELNLSGDDAKRLQIRVDPSLHYLTDRMIFKTIVKNLLNNALKYSSSKQGRVLLDIVEDGDTLRLRIMDEGIGIPKEELPSIFDRFYRASNAMHFRGTGLGLTIVKNLVGILGGSISVDSIENQYTEFVVELPLQLHPPVIASGESQNFRS